MKLINMLRADDAHWESFVGHCFENPAGYLRFAAYKDGQFAMEEHGGPDNFIGFVGTPEQVAKRYAFAGSLRENFFDMDYIMPPLTEEEIEVGQPTDGDLISRSELLDAIRKHFPCGYQSLSEDCKLAYDAIMNYSLLVDGDLVSREGLLNAISFGYDLAYLGEDLQFFQDAIVGIPAASVGKVDDLISRATTTSEQSKETADRPNMLRDGIEIG